MVSEARQLQGAVRAHHADVIAIKQNFGKFRVSPGVVTKTTINSLRKLFGLDS